MTALNKRETRQRETRRWTGTWRSAILPLAIVAVNVACLVVDQRVLDAVGNWELRFSNDCGRLVVPPSSMTFPLDPALALSALSIVATTAWFIRRRKAGDRRGFIVFVALALACLGALTAWLILLNMHWSAPYRLSCSNI